MTNYRTACHDLHPSAPSVRTLWLGLCLAVPAAAAFQAGPTGPQDSGGAHSRADEAGGPRAEHGRGASLAGARASANSRSFGLTRVGNQLWAIGPGYKARIDERGFEFTPALGARAPRNLPLRFDVEWVGRASDARPGAPTPSLPAATLSSAGNVVHCERPGFLETYEVQADGIEQSFTFGALPHGTGDLLVRGRIATDLPLASATADAVVFADPDLGGVQFAGIFGVDARQSTVSGALRVEHGIVELSLPAEFVDRAELPLTLDPLVGPVLSPSSGFWDSNSDVAYGVTSPGNERYLVVWERYFSSADSDIRGQLLAADGTLVGGLIAVDSTVGVSRRPRVVHVTGTDAFAVVWGEQGTNGDVLAASVRATSPATVSTAIGVTTTPDSEILPDIGGVGTGSALCVWTIVSKGWIGAARMVIAPSGSVSVSTTINITSAPLYDSYGSISKSGTGRHLITWGRYVSTQASTDILGTVVDDNLNVLHAAFVIANSSRDEDSPEVDGDGQCWVVAWESEAFELSGDNDILCRSVCWNAASGQAYTLAPPTIVEADVGQDERRAAVAWLAGSALVGYEEFYGIGNYDTWIESVDSGSCRLCEGRFSLRGSSLHDAEVALSNQAVSPGVPFAPPTHAMVAWTSFTSTGAQVWTTRFLAADGYAASVGGGCNNGPPAGVPIASATCAAVGSASFNPRVSGAAVGAPAWLLLAQSAWYLPCGTCTIVPDVMRGFVIAAGNTDANGNAGTSVPIPTTTALRGVRFYEQWFVGTGGPCLGASLSNALLVTIE